MAIEYHGENTVEKVNLGAVSAYAVAKKHGFTRIPAVIADGAHGEESVSVPVNLKHFRSASIAKALAEADLGSAESIGYGAFTGTSLQKVTFSTALSNLDKKAFFGYSFYDSDGSKLSVDAAYFAGKTFAGTDGKLSL